MLGKTGEKLSVIGFGAIVVTNETAKDSAYFVSKAVDRGIDYFDVAPQYGNAQEMLGPALKPYREHVFLACKTLERKKEGAKNELYDSLKKLKTDYFDLYQFHAVTTPEDVEEILSPGGALEFFIEAKESGLIRYLGLTAHSEEAALALMDAYDFSSVLIPLNWALMLKEGFGYSVLSKANETGVGIVALKALAKGALDKTKENPWYKCWYAPAEDFEEASLCLRFTLSLPITSAVSPSHAELLWWACDIADDFRPLTEEEEVFLKDRAKNMETILKGLKDI